MELNNLSPFFQIARFPDHTRPVMSIFPVAGEHVKVRWLPSETWISLDIPEVCRYRLFEVCEIVRLFLQTWSEHGDDIRAVEEKHGNSGVKAGAK